MVECGTHKAIATSRLEATASWQCYSRSKLGFSEVSLVASGAQLLANFVGLHPLMFVVVRKK